MPSMAILFIRAPIEINISKRDLSQLRPASKQSRILSILFTSRITFIYDTLLQKIQHIRSLKVNQDFTIVTRLKQYYVLLKQWRGGAVKGLNRHVKTSDIVLSIYAYGHLLVSLLRNHSKKIPGSFLIPDHAIFTRGNPR
ncbi:hypothetical protein ES703_38803 [subsurface metagenome]